MSPTGSTARWPRRSPKHCDARLKRRLGFCRSWAMPNGRCRLHGGASSGPRSEAGKSRAVGAMIAGRREWAARMRAKGQCFPGGRKAGVAWLTDNMIRTSRLEAARLGLARWYDGADRRLSVALCASAKGNQNGKTRALAYFRAILRRELDKAERERNYGQIVAIIEDLKFLQVKIQKNNGFSSA